MRGLSRVGKLLVSATAAVTLTASGLGSGVAHAAPAAPAAPPPASTIDLDGTQWPTDLRWAVPGTTEFNAKYPGTSAAAGCGTGSDIYSYTRDFVLNTGTILDALSTTTGKGAITGFLSDSDEQGVPTSPFQTVNPDVIVSRGADSWDIGRLRDFRDKTNPDVKASGTTTVPCAKDFAPFGKPSTDSPFGFTFYDAPDQGSVDSMILNVGTDQRGGATKNAKDFWTTGAWETGDDFKVTDTQRYCSDEINPLCITAMFLHCPDPSSTQDPVALAAISNCRIWNSNILVLNAHLKAAVFSQGAADGSALHPWALMMSAGRQMANAAHKAIVIGLVLLGVAIVAGALVTGGLLAALIAAGVYTVLATGGWDALWGTVTCSASFDKCLAEAGAKAMASATEMVGKAAANAPLPSLTGSDKLLNTLAGVSGWVMLILLMLSIIGGVLTGRMGNIIPASVGVVRWGVAMGIGATVLTMAFAASNAASDAIAGSRTSGQSIQSFARAMTLLVMSLGQSMILGWLLVAIVCLIGAVAAVVVWVILTMSYQFIPLAIALMIVQMAGATGNETLRKWINRGWGLLWTILLLRPVITMVAELANVQALDESVEGLVGAVTLLLICAVAPWLIVAMFPLAASGGLGVMRAFATAAQGIDSAARLSGRAGSAASAGAGRAQMLAKTLSGGSTMPTLSRSVGSANAGSGAGGPNRGSQGGSGGKALGGQNSQFTGGGSPPADDGSGGAGSADSVAPPAAGPTQAAASSNGPNPGGVATDSTTPGTDSTDPDAGSTGATDVDGADGSAPRSDPAGGAPGTRGGGAGRAAAAAAVAGTVANAMRGNGFGANLPPRVTAPTGVPAANGPIGGPGANHGTIPRNPTDTTASGGPSEPGMDVGGGAGGSGAAPSPAQGGNTGAETGTASPSTQQSPAESVPRGSGPPVARGLPPRSAPAERFDDSATDGSDGRRLQ